MFGVGTKVWSHRSARNGLKQSVRDVLTSKPTPVHSFDELVKLVAAVSYYNPEHVLFYRGQQREYMKSSKDDLRVPSFYPSIYRSPGTPLTRDALAKRFLLLDSYSSELIACFKEQKLAGVSKLEKFPELVWAILQHYEVCATPLLDVTHSLRVAASFALDKGNEDGYLYVFGFPHPNGSITYSVDLEVLNIRLLSVCPPEAQRPYFQEGFVVGTFPLRRSQRNPSLDCGRRLIAKYKLEGPGFWSDQFPAIPHEALYPPNDRVEGICSALRAGRIPDTPAA